MPREALSTPSGWLNSTRLAAAVGGVQFPRSTGPRTAPGSWFPLRVGVLSLNDHGKNQEQGTSHHFSTHKLLLTGEIC